MGMLKSCGRCKGEMSRMLICMTCGGKFKRAEALYDRMRKERPELFGIAKPEFRPSPRLSRMREQLGDRLRRDKLYQRHLKKSFFGTPAEIKREEDRANSGFYTRHSDYQGAR